MSAPVPIDPRELAAWRRALDALPPERRAMVLLTARLLLEAGALATTRAGTPRLRPVESPSADDADTADDLTRAHARRILARHGRKPGGAA